MCDIRRQVNDAQRTFNGFRPVSATDFEIAFPNVTFSIQVPPDYPRSAPIVKRGNDLYMTLLASCWRSDFTLLNMCEHLKAMTDTARPAYAAMRTDEVAAALRRTGPDQLGVPDRRGAIVGGIPCVADARRVMAQNKSELEHVQGEIGRIAAAVSQVTGALPDSDASSDKMKQERQQMIGSLLAEADALERKDVVRLKESLRGLDLAALNQCVEELTRIRQKQCYNRELAALLQANAA